MRKVMGLGVAALVVAASFAAPAQAAPSQSSVSAPVVVASTVAVEAPAEAVVSFETPEVGTVAAPVENISTEPGEAVEETAPVEVTEPVTPVAPVATEPEPAPVVEEPVETAPVVVTEEPAPTETVEPVVEPEPAPAEDTAPVEIAPDPYSPEIVEGEYFKGEGETYVGSFYSVEDIWTAQGNRVVKSETIFKSADGNPLSNNYIYIWHVYAPAA